MLVSLVGLTLVLISGSLACSPEGFVPRTVTQRMHDADAVLYGRIDRIYPEPRHPGAYTAEMTVYCSLKGPVTEPMVNISQAGYVDGMCHSTNLQVQGEYIVTLRMAGDRLIPDEHQYDPDQLGPAARACGIQPMWPRGVNIGTFPGKGCPDTVSPDMCDPYEPPTQRPSIVRSSPPSSMPKDDNTKAPSGEAQSAVGGDNGGSSVISTTVALLAPILAALVLS